MAMPLVIPRYTLRDLDSFPDDGSRYELLDGVLLVTPAPAPLHDLVVSNLAGALTEYLPAALARVFTRGSIDLEPNLHLEPDILVVPRAALGAGIGPDTRWTDIRGWLLAAEVSGRGATPYDRDFKTPAYLTLGVPEVWRVDLTERSVFVSRPGHPEVRHDRELTWQAPGISRLLTMSVPGWFLP